MSLPRRSLPPLNAPWAFEAAARRLSLSLAARALNVTPAAMPRAAARRQPRRRSVLPELGDVASRGRRRRSRSRARTALQPTMKGAARREADARRRSASERGDGCRRMENRLPPARSQPRASWRALRCSARRRQRTRFVAETRVCAADGDRFAHDSPVWPRRQNDAAARSTPGKVAIVLLK
jgi:hypothetical protein